MRDRRYGEKIYTENDGEDIIYKAFSLHQCVASADVVHFSWTFVHALVCFTLELNR